MCAEQKIFITTVKKHMCNTIAASWSAYQLIVSFRVTAVCVEIQDQFSPFHRSTQKLSNLVILNIWFNQNIFTANKSWLNFIHFIDWTSTSSPQFFGEYVTIDFLKSRNMSRKTFNHTTSVKIIWCRYFSTNGFFYQIRHFKIRSKGI